MSEPKRTLLKVISSTKVVPAAPASQQQLQPTPLASLSSGNSLTGGSPGTSTANPSHLPSGGIGTRTAPISLSSSNHSQQIGIQPSAQMSMQPKKTMLVPTNVTAQQPQAVNTTTTVLTTSSPPDLPGTTLLAAQSTTKTLLRTTLPLQNVSNGLMTETVAHNPTPKSSIPIANPTGITPLKTYNTAPPPSILKQQSAAPLPTSSSGTGISEPDYKSPWKQGVAPDPASVGKTPTKEVVRSPPPPVRHVEKKSAPNEYDKMILDSVRKNSKSPKLNPLLESTHSGQRSSIMSLLDDIYKSLFSTIKTSSSRVLFADLVLAEDTQVRKARSLRWKQQSQDSVNLPPTWISLRTKRKQERVPTNAATQAFVASMPMSLRPVSLLEECNRTDAYFVRAVAETFSDDNEVLEKTAALFEGWLGGGDLMQRSSSTAQQQHNGDVVFCALDTLALLSRNQFLSNTLISLVMRLSTLLSDLGQVANIEPVTYMIHAVTSSLFEFLAARGPVVKKLLEGQDNVPLIGSMLYHVSQSAVGLTSRKEDTANCILPVSRLLAMLLDFSCTFIDVSSVEVEVACILSELEKRHSQTASAVIEKLQKHLRKKI